MSTRPKQPLKNAGPVHQTPTLLAKWRPAAAILVITVLAYLPALTSGFVWDDDAYITANQAVRSPGGLGPIWFDLRATPQYYPLAFTTFWVEHQIWGLNPLGYHVVNILLQATVAILLWLVLARLKVPASWLAAAIFAVHPVHVESVAWITERKNVLSGVFSLLCMLSWLAWMQFDNTAKDARKHPLNYWGALVLFAEALLSKTAVAPLPVAMLILIWWKKKRVTFRDVVHVVPFVLLAVAAALITVHVEHTYTTHEGEGADWSYGFIERVLIAGRALWFYAGKLLWPMPITFVYPRWNVDSGAWWQYLYPLGAAGIVLAMFAARSRLGRGPATAIAVFVIMAGPVLGLISIYYMRYSLVSDHFQYLPSMSLIALLVAIADGVIQKLWTWLGTSRPTVQLRHLQLVLGVGVLLALSAKSFHDCGKFHDMETLWRDTLADNPTAWIAHNNLGTLLKDRGDSNGAIEHLTQAVRLKPDHARAHLNLASAYINRQQYEQAAAHLEIALRYLPRDGQAHLNLANSLANLKQPGLAEQHFKEALRLLPPDDPIPPYNYALMLLEGGRTAEAEEQLRLALRAKPNWNAAKEVLQQILATRPGR